MERLTARQQQIFDLIRDNLDETGYPPTRAEIAQNLASNRQMLLRIIFEPWREKGLLK